MIGAKVSTANFLPHFPVTNYTNFDEFVQPLVPLHVNSYKFVQFVTDVEQLPVTVLRQRERKR